MNLKQIVHWYLLVFLLMSIAVESFAKEPMLIVRRSGKDFDEVVKGMTEELSTDFTIHDFIIAKETEVPALVAQIKAVNPKIAVLLDNQSISLFKKYQNELPETAKIIPTVSLMGILIDRLLKDMKNATGIFYEIPIVTSGVNMRAVLGVRIKKVGIVHRKFMSDFIGKSSTYCEKENIKIVPYELPDKGDDYTPLIKKGLKQLLKKDSVDAIWVPNDNTLLTPVTIRDVWSQFAKESKIPVIVGVEILVNPTLDFGTFAVLPDHIALGSQAADMVYDIMDNDWDVAGRPVEPPLSVYKIINLPQAKNVFRVKDENLRNVDRIVK
jgi:ABC-type uncharacterized transport system substrate-binding protein